MYERIVSIAMDLNPMVGRGQNELLVSIRKGKKFTACEADRQARKCFFCFVLRLLIKKSLSA